MLGLDDDHNTDGREFIKQGLRDLLREAFLYLQAAREYLGDPCEL